jgi:hypothetical protein
MLTDVPKAGAHISEHKPQPPLIAQLACQGLGLLHVVQDAVIPP